VLGGKKLVLLISTLSLQHFDHTMLEVFCFHGLVEQISTVIYRIRNAVSLKASSRRWVKRVAADFNIAGPNIYSTVLCNKECPSIMRSNDCIQRASKVESSVEQVHKLVWKVQYRFLQNSVTNFIHIPLQWPPRPETYLHIVRAYT